MGKGMDSFLEPPEKKCCPDDTLKLRLECDF